MDEASLIKEAQQGDVQAFNTLVLHHQAGVYNMAYKMMKQQDLASVATQKAFIRAFKSIKRLRGNKLRPWLLRIVTNICYDELRRYQRHPHQYLEDLADQPDMIRFLSSKEEEEPEEQQYQSELMAAIARCLDQLSTKLRAVTVLADVEDYSYKEIADILSINEGTLKSRLSRARRQLQECLQGSGELLPAKYRADQ